MMDPEYKREVKGEKASDPLAGLTFKESSSDKDGFIKFKAGVPVKLRVFTINPTIHFNKWGKEQISFAVWNWDEDKAMILSKGASIARQITNIHRDEDFGADITSVDIKIMPTGEDLNREYTVNVLPKAQTLTPEHTTELEELDKNLGKIFKNSVRAEDYNNGVRPVQDFVAEGEPQDPSEQPF